MLATLQHQTNIEILYRDYFENSTYNKLITYGFFY